MVLPGLQDRLDRRLTDVLHGCQAEADAVIDDGETLFAVVDIGRKNLDRAVAALGDVLDDLVGILGLAGQEGGHEFHGVMGLEIGGLVGYHGVGGTVGLVEAVTGEMGHEIENFLGFFRRNPLLAGAGDELLLLLVHLLLLLFPHGPAEEVGVGETEAGESTGDPHHLLLVEDDPVG